MHEMIVTARVEPAGLFMLAVVLYLIFREVQQS